MGRTLLLLLALAGCANAPPYARCGGSTSCAMGSCTQITLTRSDGTSASANVCTNRCGSDADCPDDGACIALAHDPSTTYFCVKRCTSSSDCASGLTCTTLTVETGATLDGCLP